MFPGGREGALARATRQQILELLQTRAAELTKLIGVPGAQLSLPVKPKKGRAYVQVSVRPGQAPQVPAQVSLPTPAGPLDVSLEPDEAAQDYQPLRPRSR